MFFKKKTHSLKAYADGQLLSIEKVNDAGKIWFTLQFTDRSDIRIVTEIF